MDNLTYREKQVLKYLLEGCTNKEIAGKLFISTRTLVRYLEIIYIKTGQPSRIKLALYAQRNFHPQISVIEQ